MSVPARFIHIGFNHTGVPPIKELEKTFAMALDWLRYSPTAWILYTTTESAVWRDRIHNTAGMLPADSFFLTEFKEWEGYMHKWVWDWLNKAR